MKFLVCAKAATDLVNIVPYMFKLIMNKRWIYSACNNVSSPHFKVQSIRQRNGSPYNAVQIYFYRKYNFLSFF